MESANQCVARRIETDGQLDENKIKEETDMAFIQEMTKAIIKATGKIWSFATTMALITVLASFVFFALTIAMPDNVLKALDIAMGLLKEVGIVGTG